MQPVRHPALFLFSNTIITIATIIIIIAITTPMRQSIVRRSLQLGQRRSTLGLKNTARIKLNI